MGERELQEEVMMLRSCYAAAIQKLQSLGATDVPLVPDPDAPSVAEVVEVLRAADEALLEANTGATVSKRLDALIARLGGSDE